MIPLSKTCDLADFDLLVPELATVDRHFTSEQPQSEFRRWEYAIALAAIAAWRSDARCDLDDGIIDVGGAGSPFQHMYGTAIQVVDPHAREHPYTLEQYVCAGTPLARVVTCLSVIEHIKDLDRFLYHLNCLVAPGGLLVITTDCWDREGPDTAHFHWMRERIFTLDSLYGGEAGAVYRVLHRYGFDSFGGFDPIYHGDRVYGPNGYSFASLAMRKRP